MSSKNGLARVSNLREGAFGKLRRGQVHIGTNSEPAPSIAAYLASPKAGPSRSSEATETGQPEIWRAVRTEAVCKVPDGVFCATMELQ